jgi:hypothetical protein
MPGKFLTTLFNGPSTAAGSAFQPQADNKILWTYKSANSASISVQWQGSVDGVAWVNVGSAQTGTTGASDSTAWPLMRANVTVTTNTAKTLTSIARVGSTATATLVAHGFIAGDFVTIAGATPAGYNGVKEVLTAVADSFTFAVDSALTTPPTGTITAQAHVQCKMSC